MHRPFYVRYLTWQTGNAQWLWVAGVFMVVSGGLLATALGYLRTQAIHSAVELNNAMVQVVAEQTTRTLQTIDQRLALTATTLALIDRPQTRTLQSVDKLFQQHLDELPFVLALSYLNAEGRVQYDSVRTNTLQVPTSAEVGGTDYAAVFRAQPQLDFYLANPMQHDQHGDWLIHAARPIRSPTGEVLAILVADIDPTYFDTLWRSINYGAGGSISLMRRDGTMMIRSPFVAAVMGKSFKDRPIFRQMLPIAPHGNYQDTSAVDGTDRLFAYRTLVNYPEFAIILGQSIAQVLTAWQQWVKLVLSVWGLACLTVTLLCYFMSRVWNLKDESERDVRTSEERYHALFESSLDAILLTSPDGQVLAANPATCTLFDRTIPELKALGRNGLLDLTDARLKSALEVRARTGQFKGELAFLRKGGEPFVGEVFASIFLEKNGEKRSTMIIRDLTERLRAESSLRESAEKMQGLTRRVIGAQEAERRRVASELHDELGQALTAIKINLQSGGRFKQRSPEALAHENIRIVDDALQQMRRLALALRPSILDNLGLTPALHWLGKQSALRAEFQFDFMPVQFSTRLASELETTCFRIVQEALTNTVRHAQARNVTVAMRLADDHVVISVHDDGVGFDAVEAQARSRLGQSFGVLGMLERAALVGGTLEVVSELGRGCTLTLRCPLQIQTEMT